MITEEQLNPHKYVLTRDQKINLLNLIAKVNFLIEKCPIKDWIVNSGVRSESDQMRISPGHPHDAHIQAAAVDIADEGNLRFHWCMEHLSIVSDCGLYLEDAKYTPAHLHIQTIAPHSGHRIFVP